MQDCLDSFPSLTDFLREPEKKSVNLTHFYAFTQQIFMKAFPVPVGAAGLGTKDTKR